MHIKCPNSNVMLDLPDNRMDMKFHCPACGQMHRVTVTIGNPDEVVVDYNKNKKIKKYATGSYPPIVNIPIEVDYMNNDEKKNIDNIMPEIDTKVVNEESISEVVMENKNNYEKIDENRINDEQVLETVAEEVLAQIDNDSTNDSIKKCSDDDSDVMSQEKNDSKDNEKEKIHDLEYVEKLIIKAKEEQEKVKEITEKALKILEEIKYENKQKIKNHDDDYIPKNIEDKQKIEQKKNKIEVERPKKINKQKKKISKTKFVAAIVMIFIAIGIWQQNLDKNTRDKIEQLIDSAENAYLNADEQKSMVELNSAEYELANLINIYSWENIKVRISNIKENENVYEEIIKEPYQKQIDNIRNKNYKIIEYKKNIQKSPIKEIPEKYENINNALKTELNDDEVFNNIFKPAVIKNIKENSSDNKDLMVLKKWLDSNVLPGEKKQIIDTINSAINENNVAEEKSLEKNAVTIEKEVKNKLQKIAENAENNISIPDVFKQADELKNKLESLNQKIKKIWGEKYNQTIDFIDNPENYNYQENDQVLFEQKNREILTQVYALNKNIKEAEKEAQTILANKLAVDEVFQEYQQKIQKLNLPNQNLTLYAENEIKKHRDLADKIIIVSTEVTSRLKNEARRNEKPEPGYRMAWGIIRFALADKDIKIDPEKFEFDRNKVNAQIKLKNITIDIKLDNENYEKKLAANINGYNMETIWSPLFRKPIGWMAKIAEEMKNAQVDSNIYKEWNVFEGPGGIIAINDQQINSNVAWASINQSEQTNQQVNIFFNGKLYQGKKYTINDYQSVNIFKQKAKKLAQSVQENKEIPQELKQALAPIIAGTYEKIDPNDYFDGDFCRRLIEADYLEKHIKNISDEIKNDLENYRKALNNIEKGAVAIEFVDQNKRKIYAVRQLTRDIAGVNYQDDKDQETGETLPPYVWRIEDNEYTSFYSPMPARFIYAFQLEEKYKGIHTQQPDSRPVEIVVHHPNEFKVASFEPEKDKKARGSVVRWAKAIEEDSIGYSNINAGPPAWSFPLHVLERNDQGDPKTLATINGVVNSPEFEKIVEDNKRKEAQDLWLDMVAETLMTPGELGLLYSQFSRYCSDSPLPEMPNLIGSRVGLGDQHQTVYEFLDRKWVGRFVGDCDDLAEFFQVITRRQGKLSHVMQLPGHAACGYVDKLDNNEKMFVVLQTGPVLQFKAPELAEAVETAYRYFDREGGETHLTADAVPLLLRFAGEQTRTAFVLSARIYDDDEYAQAMIRVQSYWHDNVFSAAITEMEKMLKVDREIGSIKELASLYERVAWYEKSANLREEELMAIGNNQQARLSAFLELAALYYQAKEPEKGINALDNMQEIMIDFIKNNNATDFFRAMSFRGLWAMYLTKFNQPAKAWDLLSYDVGVSKQQLGAIPEQILRVLLIMYEKLDFKEKQKEINEEENIIKEITQNELLEAFTKGFFKNDDPYNTSINRYAVLGRFAVAEEKNNDGIKKLLEDGPYPNGPKEHSKRIKNITEEDWKWFRITPALYLSLAIDRLDKEENPEIYDPELAKKLLEKISVAVKNGAGLGSDISGEDDLIKGEILLAFINHDIKNFEKILSRLQAKDYSRFYDEAATIFGTYCGLIPVSEFDKWIDIFSNHFPGKQHYFKVVYRAIDKEHYEHAEIMAKKTAEIFLNEKLLVEEAKFVEKIVPELKNKLKLKIEKEKEKKEKNDL